MSVPTTVWMQQGSIDSQEVHCKRLLMHRFHNNNNNNNNNFNSNNNLSYDALKSCLEEHLKCALQ